MRSGARHITFLLTILWSTLASAQPFKHALPGRSLTAQYAGSIGLGSITYMRHNARERIGVGLSYGHTPRSHGGPLNTWTIRFLYSPWKLRLSEHWRLEPLQTGLFVAYTTGLDLQASWPSHLEKGYYWWTPSFRQHIYLRSQFSYERPTGTVRRVGAYLEVNTNDLYVYSWWPNRSSISVSDIVFLGAGVQVYFAPIGSKRKH